MGFSTRETSKESITGFGLWLSNLGESSKKQGFKLHWVLSGSRGSSIIRHLSKSDQQEGASCEDQSVNGKDVPDIYFAMDRRHF